MNEDIEALKKWFLNRRRIFPWREDASPYAVWVSEVMLQQTRAAVVVPYFLHWMERFPTIQALAAAELDDVIKAWEGLGYYSRARNLHAGAQLIVKEYEGRLPQSAEELQRIKGLGPYTVGAIRAFAFKQKAAAVDGNVLRVMTRYTNDSGDITRTQVQRRIREKVESLLPEEEPWLVSEGLIELGATVCLPKPDCASCPMQAGCEALASGTVQDLPQRKPRPKTEELYRWVGVIVADQYTLIRRGTEGQIMHDLHEFPYVAAQSGAEPRELLSHLLMLPLQERGRLNRITHGFTRYRVHLDPWIFNTVGQQPVEGYQWVHFDQLADFAFSSGHRRLLHALTSEKVL